MCRLLVFGNNCMLPCWLGYSARRVLRREASNPAAPAT
jgi:hypothetical protein